MLSAYLSSSSVASISGISHSYICSVLVHPAFERFGFWHEQFRF